MAGMSATFPEPWWAYEASAPPWPPVPSRDQLCTVRCSLQGLTVQTQQYGTLPLFDPVIGWLDVPADRAACYDVKARAGDTHVNLALSGQYAEPGQAYANIPGRDFSSADGLQALRALITEIIQA